MEPQQQQQQNPPANEENGKGGGYLCRQTSTRWTPTTEQIRILKDLYYNNGVRSPSADQIQKISARLRQYGKIEGKNVFYWFQNHKARERQKKRFTTTSTSITNTTTTTIATELPMQRPPPNITHAPWKPYEDPVHTKYHNVNSAAVSTGPSHSSAGVFTMGQVRNYGYGSKTMEKSFRDCSISSSGGNGVGVGHNFGWIGFDPYASSYPFFDKNKSVLDDHNQEEEENEKEDIETLPLFPMHGEDNSNIFCNVKPNSDTQNYTSSWYFSDDGNATARTSLELSLNSYGTGRSTD